MPKLRGCVMFRTRGIRQKVSLKSIGFSMETPCWSPSEGLQHGDRKPVETSGVYFGSLKTLILSVKLENICIGISVNILVTQNLKHRANRYFRARKMLPRSNADITHGGKTQCSIFKTKYSTELKTGQQMFFYFFYF